MVSTGTTNLELIFLKKINIPCLLKVHSISENALAPKTVRGMLLPGRALAHLYDYEYRKGDIWSGMLLGR
jgi:hypothetical protein